MIIYKKFINQFEYIENKYIQLTIKNHFSWKNPFIHNRMGRHLNCPV